MPETLDATLDAIEKLLPGDWLVEVIRWGVMAGDTNPYTGLTLEGPTHRYRVEAAPAWKGSSVDYSRHPERFVGEGDSRLEAAQRLWNQLRDPATWEPASRG